MNISLLALAGVVACVYASPLNVKGKAKTRYEQIDEEQELNAVIEDGKFG